MFSPLAMERLDTVSKYEGVDPSEVIRRSVYANKELVDQNPKTVRVGNRYEHNFKNGLLQPYNPDFYMIIYGGLAPNYRDILGIMLQTHKIPDLGNINLCRLDLSQNFVGVAGAIDVDWKKAIRMSLWNYTEIRLNQAKSIDTTVRVIRADNTQFVPQYPAIVNRRIGKTK
jgi:hypothetical protein